MARKLFLHIGPPKTGTSVVQDFLRQHDNSVVVYPKTGIAAGSGHAGLVWTFFQGHQSGRLAADSRDRGRTGLEELLAELSTETRHRRENIVISSETLAKPYGSCKDIRAFIRRLEPVMSTASLDVEIVLACREHYSWAGSIYNQAVKSKNTKQPEVRDPDEFLRHSAPRFRYANLVQRLRETGFKITLLNYHPSAGWFKRFLNHVGFEDSRIPAAQTNNVSLSVPMLIAKLAANRVLKTENERRRFAQELKRMTRPAPSPVSIFGPDACSEAETWFAADRLFLQDEFGIHFPASEHAQSGFLLDAAALAEVAAVVERLDGAGDAVLELAMQYVRR